MTQLSETSKKTSTDWLVRGVLTKLGDIFDRFTGRGWTPSSSIATSQVIERLKVLLDAEATDGAANAKFVPHIIQLKTQWDKFSTDAEDRLKVLEREILVAVIDHINDRRYHTYAPVSVEVKPDYFTSGVKVGTSFDINKPAHEAEVHIAADTGDVASTDGASGDSHETETSTTLVARFEIDGRARDVFVDFNNKRRISVGRSAANDLVIDDPNVSKMHAVIVADKTGGPVVSDTGSTNGTFVGGRRIDYGETVKVTDGLPVTFGTVEVRLEVVEQKRKLSDESARAGRTEPASADAHAFDDTTAVHFED